MWKLIGPCGHEVDEWPSKGLASIADVLRRVAPNLASFKPPFGTDLQTQATGITPACEMKPLAHAVFDGNTQEWPRPEWTLVIRVRDIGVAKKGCRFKDRHGSWNDFFNG